VLGKRIFWTSIGSRAVRGTELVTRGAVATSVRAIVERMADGIVIVGVDGVIRFSNPAAQQLFGRAPAELEGMHLGYPAVAGENAEIEIVRPGGESVSVELRVVAIEWEGEDARLASLRDVTDRKRAEERASQLEEERLARAEAEAASRAKSEFLAMMSHELRTPLNAVIGYAELMKLGIPGPLTGDQHAQLSRILTSARHLLALVNEILDLSRVDAGRLSLARGVARAEHAIDAAIAVVQPMAEGRGIAITVDRMGAEEARYDGDEIRVRQILVNLLTNAVKFTDPGGRVTIGCGIAKRPDPEARLQGVGPWAYLLVEDTGIGIPAEQISAIFDPFVQVDSTHTRPREGSGLGLTISRRLARLMKGDLSVKSTVGRGSAFTLWLPAATVEAADTAQERERQAAADARLHGLADVGEVLLRELESVIDAFVARLRAERIIPSADTLRFSQLADRAATYVADVAAVLIAAEESRGEPSSIVTGASEVQRLVAERHGARRARLGWSRETVAREWGILREEIDRAIRRHAATIPASAVNESLIVIERFIAQADQISGNALERERVEGQASRVEGRATAAPDPRPSSAPVDPLLRS
jgi:signal transduction histidine kinase